MKTFRFENIEEMYYYEKDSYIGALHAVMELLHIVLTDKSWDKIISISMDSDTFEGIVEYEDCILEGNVELKTAKYTTIHMECYEAAIIMGRYLDYRFPPNQDIFCGYTVGYIDGLHESDPELHITETYIAPYYKYIGFIQDLADSLFPGDTLTREFIENRFNEMGFSFPEY